MKALYHAFFYIPRHGKIRDKVLLTRVAVTVITMVFCLVAMSATAYAFFTCSVSSGYNVIQAADFDAIVTVMNGNTPVPVTNPEQNCYQASLEAGTDYSVTVTPTGTAQTGFCVVSAKDGDKVYHTRQLNGASAEPVRFTLKVTADATVEFFAHWGTSSHYPAYANIGENDEQYVLDDEVITIAVAGVEPSALGYDGEETTTGTAITTTVAATTTTTTTMTEPATTTSTTTTATAAETTTTTAETTETQIAAPSASSTETTTTTAAPQADEDTPATEETE